MFYLGDANYNVTEVVQYNAGSGTVAGRRAQLHYDPCGKVTVLRHELEPDWRQPVHSIDNTIFYAGENSDTSTGLCTTAARYYDPPVGPVH